MELLITIAISLFIGFVIGAVQGWSAGKIRTRKLLSFLSNRMDQLRLDSKIKVMRRDIAKHYSDIDKADELTKELSAEGMIYYEVLRAVRDWCHTNNEKDPFAI